MQVFKTLDKMKSIKNSRSPLKSDQDEKAVGIAILFSDGWMRKKRKPRLCFLIVKENKCFLFTDRFEL